MPSPIEPPMSPTPAMTMVWNSGAGRILQALPQRADHAAQAAHERAELGVVELLSGVGPCLLGGGVHLDDEAVGAGRGRREGQRRHQLRRPAAWLGSTQTGRWVSSLRTGTALTSRVKRVAVSKVRMPRSHSTTLGLPWLRMYSAACRYSAMAVDMPRLNSTGLSLRPTSASRAKFCVLRAPICSMSAVAATTSTCSGEVTSVTTGMPVASRGLRNRRNPSSPSPWKE